MVVMYICKYALISILLPCLFCYNLDTNHVIIYEDPQIEKHTRSSYFGFSLLLYSGSSTSDSWIQIGAPRGNDTSLPCVKEPGLVFRCPIAKPCKILRLENYQNDGKKCTAENIDMKKESWIGGAMDIKEDEEKVVICGHRRKSGITTSNQVRTMPGVCFVQDTKENNISSELMPLNRPDKYIQGKYLDYAVGQAGVSVHFPKNKKSSELLIGAPGVFNWRGTTILYRKNIGSNNYGHDDVMEQLKPAYFGYQVSSGKFYRKNIYVASLPRGGGNLKGSVFLYNYNLYRKIEVIKPLNGEKTGEYFGASLAVADINSDGYDDLVVGAPQHTVIHDEGCVYVFFANSERTILETIQIIKGNQKGARFGTSLAAIGDLNRDGFQDIAVGAPYEDHNTGAVYIYNGGHSGLSLSQKITAKNIDPRLRGFGISIAGSADIDKNMYNDVAVGAFKSGHVVLFRSHPVVSLLTYFEDVITQIKETDEKFDITICYSYHGRDVPERLKLFRKLSIDENYQRWFVRNKTSNIITVEKSGTCETLKVFSKIDNSNWNVFDPIKIKVNLELLNEETNKTLLLIGKEVDKRAKDDFKKDIPVVNMKTSYLWNEIEIAFASDCENICNAELHLNSNFTGLIDGSFIIGSNSELALHIFVSNTGETAYNTEVNVTIPDPVQLSSGNKICQEKRISRDLHLTCLVDSRLRTKNVKHLILPLEMSHIKSGIKNVTFNIAVSTDSNDTNKLRNSQKLLLNLKTDADVIITGKSEKVVYSYYNTSEVPFTQRYEVQKQGVSPIEVVEIDLYLPYIWKDANGNNITILTIYDYMAQMNNRQPLVCSPEIKTTFEYDDQFEYRQKRDVSSLQNEAIYQPPSNRTLYINCSTQNVVCFNIKCAAGPFSSNFETSASIEIGITLNFTQISALMRNKDIVHLVTSGAASIKKPEGLQKTNRSQSVMVATSFANTTNIASTGKPVATWIIALSIIAGVFIFMFIVIGLMKAGFFERKKKEELKALKAEDAMNEFTVGKVHQSIDNGLEFWEESESEDKDD